MKGIRIVATGRSLPKKLVTNEDLAQIVDTNDEWIQTRTGIKSRYQCEEETCIQLAIEAAEKALSKVEIDREKIGAVIVATSSSDYAFPSVACMIQQACKLREEVVAFDISAACTGFLMCLLSARGILQTSDKSYALLVGCEKLSGLLDYSDRGSCILFGDGAGAAIVSLGELDYVQKSWSRGNKEALYCLRHGSRNDYLTMKGSDVFKFAVGAMEQGIVEVLETAHMTMEDIDHVICHQANLRIIQHVQKKFEAYADKFYINIDHYGNTSAASIPIAIDELMEKGQLHKGEKVLLVAFGAGLTWSGTIVEV